MNLNVIVELDFKSTFHISSIAMNTNKKGEKSVPFEFAYNDRDPKDHPTLLPNALLAKLKRKSQAVYRTLCGDADIGEYYDLNRRMFCYRGVLLAPVPGKENVDKRYDLILHPEKFIKKVETASFLKLPAADKAQELYQLISKVDQLQFRDALRFGYQQVRKEFLEHYTELYEAKARLVYFSEFDNSKQSLSNFVDDKAWYFTQHKDLSFFDFYDLLPNYLSPEVVQFLRIYEVSDLKTLKAAAKLFDDLDETSRVGKLGKTTNNNLQHRTDEANNESESDYITPQRVQMANNKYQRVLKQTNTGRLGYTIGAITSSSPVIKELEQESFDASDDQMDQIEMENSDLVDSSKQQQSNLVDLDDQVKQGDLLSGPMQNDGQPGEPGQFGKNVAFFIDKNGAPLLHPEATIDARNLNRPKSKKIDKNAPVILKPASTKKKSKAAKKTSPSVSHTKKPLAYGAKAVSPDLKGIKKKLLKKNQEPKEGNDEQLAAAESNGDNVNKEPAAPETIKKTAAVIKKPADPSKLLVDDQSKKADASAVTKESSVIKKPDDPPKELAADQSKKADAPVVKQPNDEQSKKADDPANQKANN